MTSANNEAEKSEAIKQAVGAFKSLNPGNQLAALALIYKEVASAIPANAIGAPSSEVSGLLKKVEEIPQERQVDSLQDILTAEKNEQGEVVLDPNPSKALTELVTGGGIKIPKDQYNSLDPQSKLIFWYQIAQKLGSSIPSNLSPASEVTEVLSALQSLDNEQQMNVLKRVV